MKKLLTVFPGLCVVVLLSTQLVKGQNDVDLGLGELSPKFRTFSLGKGKDDQTGSNGILSKNFLNKLVVAGYLRSNYYVRGMSQAYDSYQDSTGFNTDATVRGGTHGNQLGANKVAGMWDGYFDPFLFLYIGGDPTKDNSFGTDVILLNLMNGPGFNQSTYNVFNYMAVRGNVLTNFGKYSFLTGGIEWRKLTRFTFGQNTRYNRFSIFERRPWDPVGGNIRLRYASYYQQGTLDQSIRFANRAFKGFMVHGRNMPYNLSLDLFYGRTMSNPGWTTEQFFMPAHNLAVKLDHELSVGNKIGFNSFYSRSFLLDRNSDTATAQFQMYTFTYDFDINDIHVFGEVGLGGYESPTYNEEVHEEYGTMDPALVVDVEFPKRITFLPLSLRGYYIDRNFVNRNGEVANSTIAELNRGFAQGATVLAPDGGQMMNVGDLVNNRMGFNFNTEVKVGRVKLQIGNEIAQDIADRGDSVNTWTYNHRVNGLTWSRLKPFPNPDGFFGPNQQVQTFYRGAYETVTIDSVGMTKVENMRYNALDIQLKANPQIGGKNLYIFNLNTFNSIQPAFSFIPKFNDDAFIRVSNHELDIFYELHRDVIIDLYFGYERVIGNQYTDARPIEDEDGWLVRDETHVLASGETEKPIGGYRTRNQTGRAIGIGLDIALSPKAYLFLRQRWYSYIDKGNKIGDELEGVNVSHVAGERFSGYEATVELKMFF